MKIGDRVIFHCGDRQTQAKVKKLGGSIVPTVWIRLQDSKKYAWVLQADCIVIPKHKFTYRVLLNTLKNILKEKIKKWDLEI